MTLEIRLATTEDIPSLKVLFKQLGYNLSEDQLLIELNAHTATVVYVAEVDGVVVGSMALNTRRHLHHAGIVTTIDSLIVNNEHRSSGLGGQLIETAISYAKSRDAKFLDVHSNIVRQDARRFYERNGFEVTSDYFVLPLK